MRHTEIMEVNTRESGRLEAVSRTPESNHGGTHDRRVILWSAKS